MLLANVMVTNEATGHLRDSAVINYLFKSVFELVDVSEDSTNLFGFEDIAILADASYKSQMDL